MYLTVVVFRKKKFRQDLPGEQRKILKGIHLECRIG
jgi:hypothetical protein